MNLSLFFYTVVTIVPGQDAVGLEGLNSWGIEGGL